LLPKKRKKVLSKIRVNLMIRRTTRRNQNEPRKLERPVLQKMQKKKSL